MFDERRWGEARAKIESATQRSFHMIEEALADVGPLKQSAQKIRPRHVTAISVVASDGGHNLIGAFNFLPLGAVQVVDSRGKVGFFDVIGPEDDTDELSQRHRDDPTSALGILMRDLNVNWLRDLSSMIQKNPKGSGWMTVYRDLCEWATIYHLIRYKDHTSDTLILRDGLLRTKIFKDKFVVLGNLIKTHIEKVKREDRRNIYLVGLAKSTNVITRYGVALDMGDVFPEGSPMYVPVPYALQKKVYQWEEYIRLADDVAALGVGSPPDDTPPGTTSSAKTELPKFNIGEMHFVRFGNHRTDPVWTIDTLWFQKELAQTILGSLLNDTISAFPIPCYPMSLQDADRHAQVSGLDREMLDKELLGAIRNRLVPAQQAVLDALPLNQNVAARRYNS
ncbi:hypothetical protein LK468_08885 [Mycobacteroides abscessus]|uniref:hypothetical protein n=1 Tax=Mycobacteroides abscessus TaxID=36809 RepID=UPI00092CB001|nr:hypothetical protein [Mycobacteroides abscessus]UEA49304.1 hypothetical protein LK451_03715 [Mycobacteroides abscessus subsp. abscessus]UEA54890.1 hypothetical protein LK468_08885 [Mycobacteroides abscessus]SHR17640.1 Uncharacterised protein [Mycobacteroides abscessus subsp. bolletii]SHS70022.1 Uncharacterised protein [Mycobacteroides abscessus subsp. bolletii]SHS90599.1 Uncharacterised protein [Mycobacteroides abscessus subsp. bolletii]